ncbi:MAG: N-acetylmuramoyl-L-alanine amidase [Bacteroidia bacterium]|nr:N-acetylmuramoyl-L-alanine amidase [Bacteroidia bacterium]
MTHQQVADVESAFRQNGLDGRYLLEAFDLEIPRSTSLRLRGFTCRPASGFAGYYVNEKPGKEKIVLHFTAGHLRGDIQVLSSEERGKVSVAFVVARDGTIYQLFSSAAWSYHLGRGAAGGNEAQSKISIGIEISNYGPLTLNGRSLETAYSTAEKPDVYCTLDDTGLYHELAQPFRGYRYYAAYTGAQYDALIVLLRYLTATYAIPAEFLPESQRMETTEQAASFRGILSHVNFRTDKSDIGPAFDWARVIAGVQAAEYIPEERYASTMPVVRTRGLGASAMRSEAEIEDRFPGGAAPDSSSFPEADYD